MGGPRARGDERRGDVRARVERHDRGDAGDRRRRGCGPYSCPGRLGIVAEGLQLPRRLAPRPLGATSARLVEQRVRAADHADVIVGRDVRGNAPPARPCAVQGREDSPDVGLAHLDHGAELLCEERRHEAVVIVAERAASMVTPAWPAKAISHSVTNRPPSERSW